MERNLAGGTAIYTFDGSPGACTNAMVTGTFKAGEALGATHVVTLSLNVATAGTYIINTATVNGISFTGSGTFAATGPQTISLSGTGIPTDPGTFSFTPGTTGCAFNVTILSGGGTSGGTALYTLDGAPGNCTGFSIGGTYSEGVALGTDNVVTVNVIVTTPGTYIITTNAVNGIEFSASGTFLTAGTKVVQLAGSGTPLVAGTFDFTPGTRGCTFPLTVTAIINPTDFIKCTIDGVARTFNVNLAGVNPNATIFALGGDETTAANTPSFLIGLTKSPAITTGTYNRFSLINTVTFSLASYDDGVTATAWETGVAGQSGEFTVVVTLYTSNRIQGTFSGTLYSNDGQGSGAKVITAGQFSVPY